MKSTKEIKKATPSLNWQAELYTDWGNNIVDCLNINDFFCLAVITPSIYLKMMSHYFERLKREMTSNSDHTLIILRNLLQKRLINNIIQVFLIDEPTSKNVFKNLISKMKDGLSYERALGQIINSHFQHADPTWTPRKDLAYIHTQLNLNLLQIEFANKLHESTELRNYARYQLALQCFFLIIAIALIKALPISDIFFSPIVGICLGIFVSNICRLPVKKEMESLKLAKALTFKIPATQQRVRGALNSLIYNENKKTWLDLEKNIQANFVLENF